MQKTKIQWLADEQGNLGWSWNPIRMRCTPVSEGCANCWHIGMAKRLAANPTIKVSARLSYGGSFPMLDIDELSAPLHLKTPSRIAIQLMGDLLHEKITPTWWLRIFGTIAQAKQHTYFILTKRANRLKDLFYWLEIETHDFRQGMPLSEMLPKNLWFGVSVENQQTADERIPLLLQTPAAHRFVSYEPALGPVDFGKWVKSIPMILPEKAPDTWKEWNSLKLWPEWIPEKWRINIEDFWGCFGRKPKDWLNDAIMQNAAPHGAQMTSISHGKKLTGRFVHTWNNMCILIEDNGLVHVTSTPRNGLFDPGPSSASFQGINWLIMGGETGPGARPMHPEWVRSTRDQCKAAGVPFFFKQWGEYVTRKPGNNEPAIAYISDREVLKNYSDAMYYKTIKYPFKKYVFSSGETCEFAKVGAQRAGCLLDGKEYKEFPKF